MKKNNKDNEFKLKGFIIVIVFLAYCIISPRVFRNIYDGHGKNKNNSNVLRVLSSYDNKPFQDEIVKYANENLKKQIIFEYQGDLDIVDTLNNDSSIYDAVWISNSMWLYMLDNSYLTSNSSSVGISPVIFGIRKSKAKELNLIDRDITNKDIVNLIKSKKIKYVMPSVTQTNSGATAYLGFLSSLAGNPEVLTEEMLKDETLIKNMKDMFSGTQRVSGNEEYLESMFINSDVYDTIIASETSLININKTLKSKNKEELYLIYPKDGVAINDSTFAFIANDKNKEELFLNIKSYLLSDSGQKMLGDSGVRTWYGGVNENADKNIFDPSWGIDTSKYLNVTKFPSKSVITAAINLYIEELRKPAHIVFCLDYSGSMNGTGKYELTNAMDYILDYNKASSAKLQFSKGDKITVVTFSTTVEDIWSTTGHDTAKLINNIKYKTIGGTTALYDAIISGLDILNKETDDYTKTIIAMTDGAINVGAFNSLREKYNSIHSSVPIYGITFGSADLRQLNEIANLSNAKVFDGKTNLLKAFKEVRGYN